MIILVCTPVVGTMIKYHNGYSYENFPMKDETIMYYLWVRLYSTSNKQ